MTCYPRMLFDDLYALVNVQRCQYLTLPRQPDVALFSHWKPDLCVIQCLSIPTLEKNVSAFLFLFFFTVVIYVCLIALIEYRRTSCQQTQIFVRDQ